MSLNNTDDPIDNIDNADDKHLDETDRDDTGSVSLPIQQTKRRQNVPTKTKKTERKIPSNNEKHYEEKINKNNT